MKVYLACVRFMHRRFVEATDKSEFRLNSKETPAEFLSGIQGAYSKFRKSWELSPHEPSQMLALFMKSANSFCRCKYGVLKREYWLLEKESCDWIAHWKMAGKTTYLRLQCKHIEGLYGENGITPLKREIMRINKTVVLVDTEKALHLTSPMSCIMCG
jgi:hypothetical protein